MGAFLIKRGRPVSSDTTAPTLSSPTDNASGSTGGALGVTTNEGNGVLYWYVSTSATPPSASNLKTGSGAAAYGNQAVSSTGAKSATAGGLTASTTYYAHFLHRDAAGNDSAIVSGNGFTTDAASGTTLVATPSTYAGYATSAAAGDVIQLRGDSGAYGDLELWARNKAAPGVIVEPYPGHTPDISQIWLDDSHGWTIQDLEVKLTAVGDADAAVMLTGASQSRITLRRLRLGQRDNSTRAGIAVYIYNGSDDIEVSSCDIHHVLTGVAFRDCNRVLIQDNDFAYLEENGVIFHRSNYVQVINNAFREFHFNGNHPDAVQTREPTLDGGANVRCTYLTITGNRIYRGTTTGTTDAYQGLFIVEASYVTASRNGVQSTGTSPDEEVPTGINFARCDHITCSENWVKDAIIYREGSDTLAFTNNAVRSLQSVNDPASTNVTISGNTSLLTTATAAEMDAWLDALP